MANTEAPSTDFLWRPSESCSSRRIKELDHKHKEKLWENPTNNQPNGILVDMLGQVAKDNPLLNEPTLEQDLIADGEWAFIITGV